MQDLDVDKDIKQYARLLSEAMDAQLAAEAKEVEFYDLLEEDPALENNRDKALDLLDEIGAGYEEAEKSLRRGPGSRRREPEGHRGSARKAETLRSTWPNALPSALSAFPARLPFASCQVSVARRLSDVAPACPRTALRQC